MLRLFTPYLTSVKDYGGFNALMGYSVSSLFGGICPTGDSLTDVRDTYSSVLDQIIPGMNTVNPLFKELQREGEVVVAILNAISNGWRLAKSDRTIRLKTPDGMMFDLSMLNVIHIAAKDQKLCVDLSKLLKSV